MTSRYFTPFAEHRVLVNPKKMMMEDAGCPATIPGIAVE